MKRTKKRKAQKLKIITALLTAVLLLMIAVLIFLEIRTRDGKLNNAENSQLGAMTYPWGKPGTKQFEDYTWGEFLALSPEHQIAFQNAFGSYEAFEGWMNRVQSEESEKLEPYPWENPGAKQPEDYTWEEFEALTAAQQIEFQNHLGTEDFEAWLRRVQSQFANIPWENSNAKQPEDYTWEEFEALTAEQQQAFQDYLGAERFELWLSKLQNQTEVNPWDEPGTKRPEDYTWEEFEALTAEQQIAFQNYLGTDGFEEWASKAQNQIETNPWDEPGAKQPKDYTWEEFEALTAEQQIAFQNYLGTDGFEEWTSKAQNQTETNPWDEPGAKQPEDYTWEEFEALTGAQQMAFQNYLGADGFEEWLDKVQNQTATNPWDEPGAKKPEDYTWEEFEALTEAQQMAFQNYLGPEAFEEWLNRVLRE